MAQIESIVGYNGNISRSSLQTGSKTTQQQQRRRGINSGSHFDEDKAVVGFEDQVRELTARLVPEQESSQAATEVILLVGEGGSGKTTLARIVYGSVRIKRHFKNRVWVNVSNYLFRARDVMFAMLKQADEMAAEAEEPILEQDMMSRLSELLRAERYLIVVDDVGAPEVWKRLSDVFPNSNNGSRIVITTRNANVAAYATSSTLQIGRLNNEESWELFLKNVCIEEGNLNDNSVLSTFKERILKLCGGLPLAIILMGGLLSMKESSHGDWARVIENANSVSGDVLALSYLELPSHIKPCFLHMGLFPKASEVPVRRLLQLWIVEQLVTPSHLGELAAEDVADMYLEELINRNMIEVARWRSDGIPKACCMPGALYDVFTQKAADMGLFHINCKSHFIAGYQPPFAVKRLASYLGSNNYPSSDYYIQNLCSFVSFSTQRRGIPAVEIGKFLNKIILSRDVAWLTVLDLEGVYKPRLPKTLGKLLNLKYLGLRSTLSEFLPESVCDLPCLEMLDVKHTMISTLPSSIWMVKSLRHLYMDWIHFGDLPNQVSSDSHLLAKLHTLWGLSISEQSPMLNILNKITSLRKLGLKFSLASQELMNNWISQLTNLQTLRLRSVKKSGERGTIRLSTMADHQNLLDLYLLGVLPRPINFKHLPPNLKVLTLSMTQLRKDPMQMLGQLPYLNVLRLFADCYLGEEMSCRSGGFPLLHVLKVWKLIELKEWTVEEGAMPCLRELEIRACKSLERLNGLREVTTLKELILTNMPSHFTTDVKESIREDVFIKENKWKPCPLLA
ncbi:disease resistance protein RPP8 isoform X2 [Elaeis guineensis]